MNHTPTPWDQQGRHVNTTHGVAPILSCNPEFPNAKANAEYIVRCVNAHDALVAALRDVLSLIPAMQYFDDPRIVSARAALALAEGK